MSIQKWTVNRPDQTKKGRSKKSKISTPLPPGRSYIDYLPDDVMINIFKMKHQMEFQPVIKMLSKLQYFKDKTGLECTIPPSKLYKRATTKKGLYISIRGMDHSNFTNESDVNNEHIKKEYRTKKIKIINGCDILPIIQIKFTDKLEILFIDVLFIIAMIGLSNMVTFNTIIDVSTIEENEKWRETCLLLKLI